MSVCVCVCVYVVSHVTNVFGQGKRRNAPPPPPPAQRRRTQPGFMRELTAEMAERKVTRESHDMDTTPLGSIEHLDGEGSHKREEMSQSKRRMTTGSSRGTLKPRNVPAPPPPFTAQATPPLEAKPRPPPVAGKPKKPRKFDSLDQSINLMCTCVTVRSTAAGRL